MDYIIIGAIVILIIALLLIFYNSMRVNSSPMPTYTAPNTPVPPPVPPTTTPATTPTAPPSPITVSIPELVGCYADANDRALPTTMQSPVTLDECAKTAKEAGSSYFGMQYPEGSQGTGKAQCWYGNGQYDKHGGSTKCYLKDFNNRYIGGVWANSVYRV